MAFLFQLDLTEYTPLAYDLFVIYYWAVSEEQILMLLMYPKNVQDNLSPTQLKILRQVIEDEYK